MRKYWPWVAPLLALAIVQTSHGALLRVTGDRVNLRASAREDSEVVGQVSTGTELIGLSSTADQWVQVVPPSSIDLWIFAELVHDGAVIVSRAQVRAGAGLNFHVVGSLRRGTAVTQRGRLGDWLKIAPPEGTSLWISRDYVEVISQDGRSRVEPSPAAPPPAIPAVAAIAQATTMPPPIVIEQPPIRSTPTVPDLPPPPPLPTAVAPGEPQVIVEFPPPVTPATPPQPEPTAAPAFTTSTTVVERPPVREPVVVPPPATPTPPAAPPPSTVKTPTPTVKPPPPPPPARTVAGTGTPPQPTSWEKPSGSGKTIPVQPVSGSAIATSTRPVQPRVLFPQDPAAYQTVGPARIPADRLSPRHQQGRNGQFTGRLSRPSGVFFTPSNYRLMEVDRTGKAITICYVMGNREQLENLTGSQLVINGPVYHFKSTQYPAILATKIEKIR